MIARGHLYDQDSSNRVDARISVHGDCYSLKLSTSGAEFPVDVVSVSTFINGIPQRLVLSTGQTFVPLDELPEGFLTAKKYGSWRTLSKLEKFSPRNVIISVLLLVFAVVSIRGALPFVADAASRLVPESLEATIGQETFAQFDELLLKESRLSASRQTAFKEKAAKLTRSRGIVTSPEIRFRSAPAIGANAFAFPGGPIVVTDQLVDVVKHDDAVVAVIAHELGHIEGRHSLRQIFRAAGLLILASTILGADEIIVDELSAVALGLVTSGYSRGFETEADEYATRLLLDAGYPPEGLAQALDALAKQCEQPCAKGGWFSTHPDHSERIRALKAFSE